MTRGAHGAIALLVLSALGITAPVGAQEPAAYRLTLGDAARLAAQRSNPVLEARARTGAAEARLRGSLSDLLPRVDVDAIRGARTFNTASFGLDFPTLPGQEPFFDPEGEVVGPVHLADFRGRAEVPILDLAALGRRRGARAGLAVALEGEGAAASMAAGVAARAYLSTLRARAEVTAREADVALAESLLEVAQGQLDAGVGVLIDVTRAQAQIATVRAQLLSARHRADASELSLRRALRLPAAARMELVDDLETLALGDAPDEAAAVARALDARSDLSMARASRSATDEALSATRAGRLPRITAGVDDGYYGRGYARMLNTYTWSLRLTVPVFDGFGRSARVQEQEALVQEMSYRIDDLEEEVAFEVRQALLDLAAATELVAAADERRRLAELEVQQEQERVRAGVAGTADLVRAALLLNAARTARLDALSALHGSRVALAAAMGAVTELR